MSNGPIGYLFHWSSKKLVHPKGGSFDPSNGTDLIVHGDKNNPCRLQFRFVAVDGAGHYGYIEHCSSGKVVHPKGGDLYPSNSTRLVLHSDRHAGALFGFDEEHVVILHKGGKKWHPKGGDAQPSDGTRLVLHSDTHDSAKFYFANLEGDAMSPYPNASISGEWKLIQAFVTPLADHTYTVTFAVGRGKKQHQTTQHAWNVSVETAKALFTAKAEYSGYVENTSSETWSEEKEETYTVGVRSGQSVFVWQYVFSLSQYGDEINFQSTIIGDTDSQDKKPILAL